MTEKKNKLSETPPDNRRRFLFGNIIVQVG